MNPWKIALDFEDFDKVAKFCQIWSHLFVMTQEATGRSWISFQVGMSKVGSQALNCTRVRIAAL